MRVEATRDPRVLRALGIEQNGRVAVSDVVDDGELIGYDVDPPISLKNYDAAARALKPARRFATGLVLLKALDDEAAAKLKCRDLARLSARGEDAIPEDSDFVARVAQVVGMKPATWFDAALSG
jgi:hypothetical protein